MQAELPLQRQLQLFEESRRFLRSGLPVIIPIICLVGAWTYPPVATPMELKVLRLPDLPFWTTIFWFWLQRKQTNFHTYFFASAFKLGDTFSVRHSIPDLGS